MIGDENAVTIFTAIRITISEIFITIVIKSDIIIIMIVLYVSINFFIQKSKS
jgi:hypothetical protein